MRNETKFEKNYDVIHRKQLSNVSWAEIKEIADKGLAEKTFRVGDEKIIELTTGEQVTLVILGFNHDVKKNGNLAAITFGTKNMIDGRFEYASWNKKDNHNNWQDSKIRKFYLKRFENLLPNDLSVNIATINKVTIVGKNSTDIVKTTEKLFLPSLAEILSEQAIKESNIYYIKDSATTYLKEGKQYEYWKIKISKLVPNNYNKALVKYTNEGCASDWWLRSPCIDYSELSLYISTVGTIDAEYSRESYSVSFCFCI